MTTQTLRVLLITALVLTLAACNPSSPPITQPAAQPTPTTAPPPQPGRALRKNITLTQDSGSLVIELRRVVVADKTYMEDQLGTKFADATLEPEAFEAADLVGEFILILHNNSNQTLSIYPDQSTVLVQGPNGTRQIDLAWAPFGLAGMDSVGGDIYAGVTKIGGFWYPLAAGMTLDDVQTITLRFDGPSDEEFETVGPEYVFDVDLTDRPNDELTDAVTTP